MATVTATAVAAVPRRILCFQVRQPPIVQSQQLVERAIVAMMQLPPVIQRAVTPAEGVAVDTVILVLAAADMPAAAVVALGYTAAARVPRRTITRMSGATAGRPDRRT